MKRLLFSTLMILSMPAMAVKSASLAGVYLCTTVERAAIVSNHMQRGGEPMALAQHSKMTRFKIRVSRFRKGNEDYRLVELKYDGSDRDNAEWQTSNSVLHSEYTGDGTLFRSIDSPAFLTFGTDYTPNPDGEVTFTHAGFEEAGGEDTQVAVRWGRCRKAA